LGKGFGRIRADTAAPAGAVRPGPPVRDRPGGEIAAAGIFAVGVTSC
jgi:hypothetical protein